MQPLRLQSFGLQSFGLQALGFHAAGFSPGGFLPGCILPGRRQARGFPALGVQPSGFGARRFLAAGFSTGRLLLRRCLQLRLPALGVQACGFGARRFLSCSLQSCSLQASGVLARRILDNHGLPRGFQAPGFEPRRLLPGRLLARCLQLFGLSGRLQPGKLEQRPFSSLLTGLCFDPRLCRIGFTSSARWWRLDPWARCARRRGLHWRGGSRRGGGQGHHGLFGRRRGDHAGRGRGRRRGRGLDGIRGLDRRRRCSGGAGRDGASGHDVGCSVRPGPGPGPGLWPGIARQDCSHHGRRWSAGWCKGQRRHSGHDLALGCRRGLRCRRGLAGCGRFRPQHHTQVGHLAAPLLPGQLESRQPAVLATQRQAQKQRVGQQRNQQRQSQPSPRGVSASLRRPFAICAGFSCGWMFFNRATRHRAVYFDRQARSTVAANSRPTAEGPMAPKLRTAVALTGQCAPAERRHLGSVGEPPLVHGLIHTHQTSGGDSRGYRRAGDTPAVG